MNQEGATYPWWTVFLVRPALYNETPAQGSKPCQLRQITPPLALKWYVTPPKSLALFLSSNSSDLQPSKVPLVIFLEVHIRPNYLPYSTPYTKTNAPCQNHLNLNSIGMSDWDMWGGDLSLSLCCSSLMIFTSMMWDLGGFLVQATEVPGSIYTHVCPEAALDDMWTLQLYKVPLLDARRSKEMLQFIDVLLRIVLYVRDHTMSGSLNRNGCAILSGNLGS